MNLRLAVIPAAAVVAVFLATPRPAEAQVGITINGNAVNVSPPPMVQNGRVFVPLRGVFEQLGASVVYDRGTIDAQGNGRDISLRIGSTQASIDGQPQAIDVAPFIVGESTYVPLRFISEALGANVDWDDADSLVAITMNGAPSNGAPSNGDANGYMSYDGGNAYADEAPPPIPAYDQPPVPEPNEIWQPGFWQWGSNGYYWVPGTWVQPPQTGYLWTPGYWQAQNNRYAWSPGYWAVAVGFYGGINYGAGYFGHGYDGGRWSHDTFQYNTYVTHVDTTNVRNVYVDRTVIVNAPTRTSYNGGPHGVPDRPTQQQIDVTHERHISMTPVQQQHVKVAAGDRQLLATVNHNQPPVLAVARPLSVSNRPVGYAPVAPADRVAPSTYRAPVAAPPPAQRAAPPAYHEPAAAAPPVQRAAPPAYHEPAAAAPPVQRAAPPVQRAAPPAYHEPAAAAPPVQRAAPPAYHEPAAAAPPVQHAAPPVQRAAPPAYHEPAAAAPPVQHAAPPVQRAAPPAYHAPAAPAAPPAQHVAPPQPHAPPQQQRAAPKDAPQAKGTDDAHHG